MIEHTPISATLDSILGGDMPVGDVVAARRAAAELLGSSPPAELTVLAHLTMTAALLIVQLDDIDVVSLGHARMALSQLIQGQDTWTLKCRSQFVRYTALELAAQPPQVRQRLERWFDRHFETPTPALHSSDRAAAPA